MKNILTYIGILAVGVLVGILVSPKLTRKANDGHADTTTVIIYDTLKIREPQPTITTPVKVVKFATVPKLLTITDTVKVPYYVHDTLIIPIEQKIYQDTNYTAYVSGYNPKLDLIEIYNNIVTRTVTKTAPTPKHLLSLNASFMVAPSLYIPQIGVRYTSGGAYAEMGALYYNNISPYLMVGYSITLLKK
jgi:hypothetical protein